MRTVEVVIPETRDGVTHVVIVGEGLGKGCLFKSYDDAQSFIKFGRKWLGWQPHYVSLFPLALIDEDKTSIGNGSST